MQLGREMPEGENRRTEQPARTQPRAEDLPRLAEAVVEAVCR